MKKCLCALLALVCLLSGCQKAAPQQTQAPTEPESTGLYDPDHPVEQQTVGAVRAYPLGGDNYTDVLTMGSKLLVTRNDGTARVLQGENCEVAADGSLGTANLKETVYDIHAQGVAFYQEETKEVVLLNPQLQEVDRIKLPEDIQGKPAICLETGEIFYCQNNEIRALNMENNVPRLLKSHTVTAQTLLGCYFDGTVIGCAATYEDGTEKVMYLSATDGVTLREDGNIQTIETVADRYFIRRTDILVKQNIVGTKDAEPQSLPMEESESCVLTQALSMNGIISYTVGETELVLSFHDIAQGKTTAQLTLTGATAPLSIAVDEQFVWLLMQEQEGQVLYRWDVTLSAVEAVSAFGPLHTLKTPDTEGLEACREDADELEDTYGIEICYWEDATKDVTDYTLVAEHQPVVIRTMLAQLTPALEKFPKDFLTDSVRSGDIVVGFVRSIDSNSDWVQFWKNGDCWILISAMADPSIAFMEAIGYAVDSHVLGNSRDYDTWNALNPDGFRYGTGELDEKLLEGDTQAFVNRQATTSPIEDRRLLFFAAMAEENAGVFASETMQKKLRRMCEGIREAYGLEKVKEIFPWEQYLTEPMVELEQPNG